MFPPESYVWYHSGTGRWYEGPKPSNGERRRHRTKEGHDHPYPPTGRHDWETRIGGVWNGFGKGFLDAQHLM